jgi:hypothetical protein
MFAAKPLVTPVAVLALAVALLVLALWAQADGGWPGSC